MDKKPKYKYGGVLILEADREAGDKFDTISGTNGLLGASDGAFVLSKEKRTSNNATLDITGRDQPDQRIQLVKDPETLVWDLLVFTTKNILV